MIHNKNAWIPELRNRVLDVLDPVTDQTLLFGFDRLGYWLRQSRWSQTDTDVDMTGKICLITGANAGIGFACAEALARRGATVLMACRSLERGNAARDKIRLLSGNQNVFVEQLDVSLMHSVRDFASRQSNGPRIDVLIHNAGALLNQRQESTEGIEMTLATHLLGPYLLTWLLRPRLGSGSRIILVASGGMYLAGLQPQDLQFHSRPYHGATAYAEAKRGQVILARLWAKAFADQGIVVNAMHPGWVNTQGIQDALPQFHQLTRRILRSPAEGADTIVWLAVYPQQTISGAFFCDRRPRGIYRLTRTRNTPSEIEDWWQQLGQLSNCPQAFPYVLDA